MPESSAALPGRNTQMNILNKHYVTGQPIAPPFPDNLKQVYSEMFTESDRETEYTYKKSFAEKQY